MIRDEDDSLDVIRTKAESLALAISDFRALPDQIVAAKAALEELAECMILHKAVAAALTDALTAFEASPALADALAELRAKGGKR